MNIKDYFRKLRNYPILFIGTGLSLRYLSNSYSWEGLLKEVVLNYESEEHFLDLKSQVSNSGECDYPLLASIISKEFDDYLSRQDQRNGKFKTINDLFYQNMRNNIPSSRFKIFLSSLLNRCEYRDSSMKEITELKIAKKNVASVITTNYDKLIEDVFGFQPLIGNDILLSNPYGSVYKIHGCASTPNSLIIDKRDYEEFDRKYELIRAELLSLFVHHPIIFMGYSLSDINVRKILKTIFSYVDYGSDLANEIKDNFLLIEYDQTKKCNTTLTDYIIQVGSDDSTIININKLSTNDFLPIYQALSSLTLPVSVMDIRKVSNIVKEIERGGGGITVDIVGDVDALPNSEKILFIGAKDDVKYVIQKTASFITDYFKLIESKDIKRIELIDQVQVSNNQWFPIFGFFKTCNQIKKYDALRQQQISKLNNVVNNIRKRSIPRSRYESTEDILNDSAISKSSKSDALVLAILEDRIPLDSVETYLRNYRDPKRTEYKKLLCAYDYQKNSPDKGHISTA